MAMTKSNSTNFNFYKLMFEVHLENLLARNTYQHQSLGKDQTTPNHPKDCKEEKGMNRHYLRKSQENEN